MVNRSVNPRSPLQYQLILAKCPTVAFWCQTITLPGLKGTVAERTTPFATHKVSLSRIAVGPFSITFLVDKNMHNYMEIYRWISGITVPSGTDDYTEWTEAFPLDIDLSRILTSDATLLINDSNNQLTRRLVFPTVFPIRLGELQFDTTDETATFVTCSVSFASSAFFFSDNVQRTL